MQNTCFTRLKAANDVTPSATGYNGDGTAAGGTFPQVCQNGSLFPDPQLAFTYRLTDRIGLGIAVLGPSAVGNVTWPDFINGGTPAPQRYLLISSNVVLLTPTVGVGWEAVDNLRLGAAFIAGTAPSIDFINVSPAFADANPPNLAPGTNDVRSELKAHDYFIPGFTLGAIWTPIDRLDVAAWYKYMSPINATGDVTTQANYYQYASTNPNSSQIIYGDTALPNCNNPMLTNNPCGNGGNAKVTVTLPMEAKLGVRYHQPRTDVPPQPHVRDPMATDVFDAEADFTWANNSAFDYIQIRFPGDAAGHGTLPANPAIPSSTLPPNADVRHHFKDVFGVRVGGDYNVLPDQLAIRAGAFFETAAADSTYQNIDFIASERIGFALGGTYRIKFSETKGNALDLMAGYGHVFFGTLTNNGPAGLHALSGEQCAAGSTPQAGGVCSNGNQQYRSLWPVNLGTITSAINVINVGASYRF
jgi:long-chain fatty acid transport protein